MSKKQNQRFRATRYREESATTLQQYANKKRSAGLFNDVTVLVGKESIFANRLVLSCYSKFFEFMFLSPMKEQYQNQVEIQQFDGKIVRALIDFMYNGKIDIESDNAVDILSIADFLQMEGVKQFCFEFLEAILTIENCLEMRKIFYLYRNVSGLKKVRKFIGENLDQVSATDCFKDLSEDNLTSLITDLNAALVEHLFVYNAIVCWTKQKKEKELYFPTLFLGLDFQKCSLSFLQEIAKEPLVEANANCLKAVVSCVFSNLQTSKSKCSKILCVGGTCKRRTVFEVYNTNGDTSKAYPEIPTKPWSHCLLKNKNFLYCIGGHEHGKGYSNKVFCLNLDEANRRWKEVAKTAESKCKFGAAVFRGSLVVNGNFCPCYKTTEMYDAKINKWRMIASTNIDRGGHALVATEEALFAIGGLCCDSIVSSSVERLDALDGQWRYVQPMNIPRYGFAAVFCSGFIYVIGGYSNSGIEKTVEKYNPQTDQWTYASPMTVQKYRHAACVLDGKIFVVGGETVNFGYLKTIECYDPELDQWKKVGKMKEACLDHAVVTLK